MGIALVLAAARHLIVVDREVREGKWPRRDGMELRGKTMGILGLGSIGLEMARLGRGLGMRVIAWSPTYDPERARTTGVELVDRDDLLRQADVVSMCLRVHPETMGAIGVRELALMKPSAILINVARAALVDESALVEALRERRIAAAGLDVYEQEPLTAGHPLLGLENVVLSPHSGSWTHEATDRLMAMPVDNIIAYLQGRPQHVVNPDSLKHSRQRR
jgi:phosphoglycerate dehydrogenase-like enzyme